MKEDRPYVEHILDAIKKIEKATSGFKKEEFVEDEIIREYAVQR
jgi:uncharacterized protein with HEPN domain